jgi:hypothetical protein
MEISKEEYLKLRKNCIHNVMNYSMKTNPKIKVYLEEIKMYLKGKKDSENDIKLLDEYLDYK